MSKLVGAEEGEMKEESVYSSLPYCQEGEAAKQRFEGVSKDRSDHHEISYPLDVWAEYMDCFLAL